MKIYRLMSEGVPVPNNIIDDLIAEAMVAAAEKSKVKLFSPMKCTLSVLSLQMALLRPCWLFHLPVTTNQTVLKNWEPEPSIMP